MHNYGKPYCRSHLAYNIKAIKLTKELHESPLDLPVCTGSFAESAPSNGINLIHENDARLMLLGIPKHLSDQASTLANVLVHNGTRHNLQSMVYQAQNPCLIDAVGGSSKTNSLHAVSEPLKVLQRSWYRQCSSHSKLLTEQV